jgi:Cu/Ag efflux protein CusF
MIRILSIIPALLLALVTTISFAEEMPTDRPGRAAAGLVSISAVVEAVDLKARTVTLRTEDGNVVKMEVTEEARNLDQVEVGDILEVEYYESIVIFAQDAEGDLTPETKVAAKRTPKGDKPGMAVSETVTVKVVVVAINHDTRVITLRGPEGKTMTKRVDDSVERLNEVKKGDEIVIQLTTALAITVREP